MSKLINFFKLALTFYTIYITKFKKLIPLINSNYVSDKKITIYTTYFPAQNQISEPTQRDITDKSTIVMKKLIPY